MSKTIGTLEDLCDWLSTKPADEEYDYTKCRACAFYQYLTSRGMPVWMVGVSYWRDKNDRTHELEPGICAVVRPPDEFQCIDTFGNAHKRALEALAND